jgi:hypothetical protein
MIGSHVPVGSLDIMLDDVGTSEFLDDLTDPATANRLVQAFIDGLADGNCEFSGHDLPYRYCTRIQTCLPPSNGGFELAASVTGEVLKRKGEHPDPVILEGRLAALLGIQSLKLWAKASDVQHQYEDIFFGARIISDIRTVFESDGVKPLGAMVVHNLEIKSGRGGFHQSHDKFYALDNADLDILEQVIQRAKNKTASLENIIKQSNLTYFQSK